MANIPSVNPFDAIGSTTLAPIVVGASNTLTYSASRRQVLFVRNASASSVTLTLDGADAPATVKVEGTGATFNSATGASIPVAAGATVAIPLSNYRTYLVGAVTLDVSAPTDVTAWLIEV
jgi:hypothetical protein